MYARGCSRTPRLRSASCCAARRHTFPPAFACARGMERPPRSHGSAGERVMASPSWFRQYLWLGRKNVWLARRAGVNTLAQLLIGTLVCLLLLGFQQLADFVLSRQVPHPPSSPIQGIPRCVPGAASLLPVYNDAGALWRAPNPPTLVHGCTTLMYAPATAATNAVMQLVATNAGLRFGVDVQPLPGSSTPPFNLTLVNATLSEASGTCVPGACDVAPTLDCLPCAMVQDNATLTSWFVTHPNSTQNFVFFFGAYVGDLSYSIMYNITQTLFPLLEDAHTTQVKRAIDEALVGLRVQSLTNASTAGFNLTVHTRAFPLPVPRLAGYDVFSANGGQWLYIVPMISFFTTLVELVHEKEAKLRIGMKQMGLRTSAFWASWLTHGLLMSVVTTCVLEASGYIIGFDFFRNSNAAATLLLFISFNVAMLSVAILLSTLMSTTKTAQTVGYAFILLGFVFQLILTSSYAGLVDLLWSEDLPYWVLVVRFLMQRYPPFNFSKFFYDINYLAGSSLNAAEQKITRGPGFHWHDLYVPRPRKFFGFDCDLPAPVDSLYYQLLNAVGFLLIAFYLDAVLPGPHGSPAHPLFFLGCKYRIAKSSPAPAPAASIDAPAATLAAGLPAGGDAALRALAAGALDGGVQAEVRAAACKAGSAVLPPASAPSSGAEAGSVVDDGVVVRISHLRVVYRQGWSAALYAFTGMDPSTWRFGCCGRRTSPTDSNTSGSNSSASGDVVAVQDMSLTVRNHEILALLGHNGSYMTTRAHTHTRARAGAHAVPTAQSHALNLWWVQARARPPPSAC
ncbi:hypothetical protein EON62_00035 [archaeon]|nr:MAG: hypothetical protein EON62_00035 [archaeon]